MMEAFRSSITPEVKTLMDLQIHSSENEMLDWVFEEMKQAFLAQHTDHALFLAQLLKSLYAHDCDVLSSSLLTDVFPAHQSHLKSNLEFQEVDIWDMSKLPSEEETKLNTIDALVMGMYEMSVRSQSLEDFQELWKKRTFLNILIECPVFIEDLKGLFSQIKKFLVMCNYKTNYYKFSKVIDKTQLTEVNFSRIPASNEVIISFVLKDDVRTQSFGSERVISIFYKRGVKSNKFTFSISNDEFAKYFTGQAFTGAMQPMLKSLYHFLDIVVASPENERKILYWVLSGIE